jgi:hypothetical protein
MDEHDVDMERFDQLLEQSSLGTRGARKLRRRTPPTQVTAVRRLAQLRDRVAHPRDVHDAADAALELVAHLLDLGYHDQVEHLLHQWFPTPAPEAVTKLDRWVKLHPECAAAEARAAALRWPCAFEAEAADRRTRRHGTAAATPAGIAMLAVAPACDRPPVDETGWHDELERLYTELRDQVGALPVTCPGEKSGSAKGQPLMLLLVFRETPDSVTHLSSCLQRWLDREPGRRLNLAVDSATWSDRVVLYSGGRCSASGEDGPGAAPAP